MVSADWIRTLPGGELIREGLNDFLSGRCTVAACLVAIAQTRLTTAGLLPSSLDHPIAEPERQLYRLLRQAGGDAYASYNALLRELASFSNALDRMVSRGAQVADKHPPF